MNEVINWYDYFTYKSGHIYWKISPTNGVHIGDHAGNDSIDEAVAARRQAEKENNYHPNHGSV